ncbi:MAG: response regulator [Deferrisomatales bacterium]|nr:response regulator [Deferrisomatales bacterium]
MNETARSVLLLGPEGEVTRVAEALSSEGYHVLGFSEFKAFMALLLKTTPQAVVLWDNRCREELEAAFGVLRHHVCSRRSPLILAQAAGETQGWMARVANAVVSVPVDPEELCGLLDQCLEAEAESQDLLRVLVVDDDENIVLLGSHVVSGLGMIPLVAFDGPEAITKAKQLRPDLVLLDINMPQMDGFEVIKRLKADTTTSMVPIIVFSARQSEEDKVRALKLGADDYVTKPFNILELGARIDRLLNRTRSGVSASSTTGLPGSVSVEQVLVERLRAAQPFAVLYVDADRFKAFNDCYGFSRGDSVIRQIADLITDACQSEGGESVFVGHIGGDDFVVVTDPDRAEAVARGIIERFDRIIPYYYDPADREHGAIVTTDRRGQRAEFPLMTLSIAVVTTAVRPFHHAGEVADVAVQLKKVAKSRPGSVWVMDQRTDG